MCARFMGEVDVGYDLASERTKGRIIRDLGIEAGLRTSASQRLFPSGRVAT